MNGLCHVDGIFFIMSLGPMLHVDFKKWPCRPVKFKGQGPYPDPTWPVWRQVTLALVSYLRSYQRRGQRSNLRLIKQTDTPWGSSRLMFHWLTKTSGSLVVPKVLYSYTHWGPWPLNSTGRHCLLWKSTCDMKPIDVGKNIGDMIWAIS